MPCSAMIRQRSAQPASSVQIIPPSPVVIVLVA
jgi:hypothetical protein